MQVQRPHSNTEWRHREAKRHHKYAECLENVSECLTSLGGIPRLGLGLTLTWESPQVGISTPASRHGVSYKWVITIMITSSLLKAITIMIMIKQNLKKMIMITITVQLQYYDYTSHMIMITILIRLTEW